MNELMIIYTNDKWMYYKTEKETANEAYKEFEQKVEALGVDFCTAFPESGVLRDEHGNDIDSFK